MRGVSLLALLVAFFVSCAPLVKKENCRLEFEKVKALSQEAGEYKVRGNLFVKGAYLVFYGKLGKRTDITVKTPLGGSVLSVSYEGDTVCLKLAGKKQVCGSQLDMYWDYLNVKMPFHLKHLLTGRFPISENANYSCDGRKLKVRDGELELIYDNGLLEKAVFDGFSAEYSYEEGKIRKITVKKDGVEVFKIYIRELERVWD
ncbi:MAG: hypothetical protein GXN94_04975 [Aquificae bacterium]|nr:hypothetical protein [Aquificota bacterium]